MATPPPLPEFPPALLGVRFVSDDGKLCFVVRLADASARTPAGFPLAVDAGRPDGGVASLLSAAPARWLPREDEEAEAGSRRLDRVQVELGVPGMGETWNLLFSRPTDDRQRWHGYDQVALRADTRPEEIAVFPEHGGTPYGPDDWDWQEGWWYPYSTFRAAR